MSMIIPEGSNLVNGVRGSFHNVMGKWCNIIQPNTKGNFGAQWTLSIYITPEEAEWFRSCGFGKKVTEDTEKDANGNKFLNGKLLLHLSQACTNVDGTPKRPPVYVGADGRTPMTEDFGIGSIINVDFKMVAKGDGKFPIYLNAVQVIGLVRRATTSFTDTTQAPVELPEGCVLATSDVIGAAPAPQVEATPAAVMSATPGVGSPAAATAPGTPAAAAPVTPAAAAPVTPAAAAPVTPAATTPAAAAPTSAAPGTPAAGTPVINV